MAYSTAALRPLVERKDGDTASIWVYESADSLAAIQASGYFADAVNKNLRADDIIIVTDPADSRQPTMIMVTAVASGAATAGAGSALTPGVGITNGVGTVYKSWVEADGPYVIKTSILIDITGLNAGATAGDIIGVDGAGVAHLGQITTAKNGVIFKGQMTCLETPAGPVGGDDIDVYAATEGTGVEDVAISTLTEVQQVNAAASAKGSTDAFTAFPAANDYLYLVGQGTGDAIFTAGILLIEMWGHGTIA